MQMNRRNAIKSIGLASAAVAAAPWTVFSDGTKEPMGAQPYPFSLPDLPYSYDALSAFIDPETMNIHHTRHHAAYVNNLNRALESAPDFQSWQLNELLQNLDALPESIRTTVRNNGGGHANHMLFWDILHAEESSPTDDPLADQIARDFESTDAMLAELRRASLSVFGSGWSWLSWDGNRLMIESTPNQDTPVMHGRTPLVGIDVWEHAYYLRYQNRRADYVDGVLRHINWTTVNGLFVACTA